MSVITILFLSVFLPQQPSAGGSRIPESHGGNQRVVYAVPVRAGQSADVYKRQMWGPAECLLAAVNKSGEDVDTAAEKYQKEALTAIQDMK